MRDRIYAIPDIHGRADLLELLIKKLRKDENIDFKKDKIVFLGDFIDRGPDSKKVIDIVRNLERVNPASVVVLAGNHEWLCINAHNPLHSRSAVFLWHANGGGATVASYFPLNFIPEEVIKWMVELPLFYETEGFFFSHAPIPREENRRPENRGGAFTKHELTWTYSSDEAPNARNHDNGVIGVCGHVHALQYGILKPRLYNHYIFADAGCGCHEDAPLVAIEVKSRKIIEANPLELNKEDGNL